MSKDPHRLIAVRIAIEQTLNGYIVTEHMRENGIVTAGHVVPRDSAAARVFRHVYRDLEGALTHTENSFRMNGNPQHPTDPQTEQQ